MPGGLDPISELQRLTVSLRGGFEQKDGCLVFHFTGQLDAYSEKQFMEYVGDVLKPTSFLLFSISARSIFSIHPALGRWFSWPSNARMPSGRLCWWGTQG